MYCPGWSERVLLDLSQKPEEQKEKRVGWELMQREVTKTSPVA